VLASEVKLLDGLGGEIVEVFVGALGVEPGDPLGGAELDLVDVAPGALAGDQLVLERPDRGLGQRVDAPIAVNSPAGGLGRLCATVASAPRSLGRGDV
jgi:hypothetical protein